MTFNLSRFAGPMMAGFIIQYLGPGWAFAVAAGFQVVFVSILRTVRIDNIERPERSGASIFNDIAAGLRYTARHPGIGPVMFLLLASSVGTRPFIDLLPGFAASVFGRGPQGLSLMTSTVGLGAMCGGTYLTLRRSISGLTAIAVTALGVIGVGLLAFSASPSYWLAIACLFVIGANMSISATGVLTLVQSAVDGPMRGRVVSLYGVIFRGGPAIGSFTMGWAAQFVGLHIPVATGAVLCIVLSAWTMRKIGTLARTLETQSSQS
jgi:predicted MFS family arabinose efflux permease